MFARLIATLRAWFARPRLEREMREEMEAHIEQATALLVARGLSREDAERQALREFGPVGRIQEEGRDARGALWIDATLADVRYAWRQFRRRPVAVFTIILVLGLGLGVNNTVFAVIHSYATMPPRGIAKDPSLVRIRIDWHLANTQEQIAEFTRLDHVFSDVVVSARGMDSFFRPGGSDDARIAVAAYYVSPNYFEVLGARPAVGRFFGKEDDRDGNIIPAVLSHGLWHTHYGGKPDAIGKVIQVNETLVTVVGIASEGFAGTGEQYGELRIWLPYGAREVVDPSGAGGSASWAVFARLEPGVSRREADAAVKVVWARSEAAADRRERSSTAPEAAREPDVAPLLSFNESQLYNDDVIFGSATAGLSSLLFLLVVCTNVSALMVGLAATRRREIAVRLSLGASRRRLIRQLLTESVLLASAGGFLGILFLVAALRVLERWIQNPEIVVAWPVLGFTFVLALGTGVLTGLSPALHATRMSVQEALKDAAAAVSHTRSRLHAGLIVTQIALTQPLLVGLGATVLMATGELEARRETALAERIATVDFAFPYPAKPEEREAARSRGAAQFEEARQRLTGLPGVVDAVPHTTAFMMLQSRIHPADRVLGAWEDEPLPVTQAQMITTGWLGFFGVPLIAGRDFGQERGGFDAEVTIIGADLARRLWGNADPIGRRLVAIDGDGELTVIGVVDERAVRRASGSDAALFVPLPASFMQSFAVRTDAPIEPMLATIRRVVTVAAPDLSINRMTVLAGEWAEERRTVLSLIGATAAGGLLALLLSAIGLYALVSLTVAERKREIGIRGALGAGRLAIVRPYVSRAIMLAVIGMAVGLPISLVGARALNAFAEQEVIHLPAVTTLVCISVLTVVALATLIPASRAVRMQPIDTLRGAD